MICKLIFPLLASALVQADFATETFFDDLPALDAPIVSENPVNEPLNEPLNVPSDEQLSGFANETGLGRANLSGLRYGAYIERVTLSKCPRFKEYLPYFYGGLVVNSRSWKTTGNERFTSIALVKTDGTVVSSSAGAYPTKKDAIFHTWEMLYFATSFKDIRTTNPGKLNVQSWNAGQQIYIPLYMSSMDTGNAYMLHIYPQPSFLAYPNDYTFADGLLYAKGDTNRLYKFEIDVPGLIRDLSNFSAPNYRNYITAYGVVKTNSSGSQSAVAYSDSRWISLRASTQGSSTEYICSDAYNTMDVTWSQMQTILQREIRWL